MRAARWGALLVLVACKKEVATVAPAPDASADAAPVASVVPPTPGTIARLPASQLTEVLALGEHQVLLLKSIPEGSQNSRIVAVPFPSGEARTVATATHITHHCAGANELVWMGDTGLFALPVDGDKPRLVVPLEKIGNVRLMTCRAGSVLALIAQNIVAIDLAAGTMKRIVSNVAIDDYFEMLAADDTNVYWYTLTPTDAFMHAPLAGGGARVKRIYKPTQHAGSFFDLYADARGLYWIESYADRKVVRRLAPGGKEETSLTDVSDDRFHDGFLAKDDAIWRISDDGASLEKVASDVKLDSIGNFAVRGTRAAWLVQVRSEYHLVQRAFDGSRR
jgi:hypothetical protein